MASAASFDPSTEKKHNAQGACELPTTMSDAVLADDIASPRAKPFDHPAPLAELDAVTARVYDDEGESLILFGPISGLGLILGDASNWDQGSLWPALLPGEKEEEAERVHSSDSFGGVFQDQETVDPRLVGGVSTGWPSPQSTGTSQEYIPADVFSAAETTDEAPSPMPMSALDSSASTPALTASARVRRQIHKCPRCPRNYDRLDRAQACSNRHLDVKPHRCGGVCGYTGCQKEFVSKEQLSLHKKTRCTHCSKDISKRNIAKHQKTCRVRRSRGTPAFRLTRSARKRGDSTEGAQGQIDEVVEKES